MMRKLASKVVGADAYCGVGCGVCVESMAQDDLPHFRNPNLTCLGAKGSLEDIGIQKLGPRSKFTEITQAKLF